jgi:G:T/U-mismatch repair DNA glycosylase
MLRPLTAGVPRVAAEAGSYRFFNQQETSMLTEIWEPGLLAVFVGMAVDEPSETLGYHHLHPRDRFWELLEIGGITPTRMITPQERKALAEGQARGNLSDPIRVMFVQKKTSQLLRTGVGITVINQRVVVASDKDKLALPSDDDLRDFLGKVKKLKPKIVAFVMAAEAFQEIFRDRTPEVSDTPGIQKFTLEGVEVWLLGSTTKVLRGEALTAQEDAFFALGERMAELKGAASEG